MDYSDDHALSLEELARPRVAIVGSRSLAKYSTRMLARGFAELGWDLVPVEDAQCAIIQLHGAAHSVDDDRSIMQMSFASLRRAAIVIHRPDEIALQGDLFRAFLAVRAPPGPLVHLGHLHRQDPLFTNSGRAIEVVPHGFFSAQRPTPKGPPIIGTHTTWGEMRSIEHAVRLVLSVFAKVNPGAVVGYLGGIPAAALDPQMIQRMCRELDSSVSVEVAEEYGQVQLASSKHVFVVNRNGECPLELTPHFNVQIYRFNDRIRTGESSGSLHEFPSIPVIAEMNGAEVVEKLNVIKIPYSDPASISSLDFSAAAEQVVKTLPRLKSLLSQNAIRAKSLLPHTIAARYAELLNPTLR